MVPLMVKLNSNGMMSINFASLKQFYKHLKVNVLIHIQELRYNFKNLKKKTHQPCTESPKPIHDNRPIQFSEEKQ